MHRYYKDLEITETAIIIDIVKNFTDIYRYYTKTQITNITMITHITVFTTTEKAEIIGVIQGL